MGQKSPSFAYNYRLMVYAALVGWLAVMLVLIPCLYFALDEDQKEFTENLELEAKLLADTRIENLKQIVNLLAKKEKIVAAWVFDKKKAVLAFDPTQLGIEGLKSDDRYAVFTQVREQDGPEFPIVIVAGLLPSAMDLVQAFFLRMLGASFLSVGIALLLAFKIQRNLSKPILELLLFAKRVNINNHGKNDFDILNGTFNDLLEKVDSYQEKLKSNKERLDLVLWGADEGAWDWDISSGYLFLDDNLIKIFGYERQDITPHVDAYRRLQHPDDRERIQDILKEHFDKKTEHFEVEHRLLSKSGEWRWVLNRGKVVNRDLEEKPLRMTGMITDITVKKNAEEGSRLFEKVFRNTSECVCVTDLEMNIVTVNNAFSKVVGYSENEIIKNNIDVLYSDRHSKEFYDHMRMIIRRVGAWRGELWLQRKNSEVFVARLDLNQVVDPNDVASNYVILFSDITKNKQDQDEIKYLSNYDPLTNLANRAMFLEYLGFKIKEIHEKKQSCALLVVGLDHFKNINESFGRSVGDFLLQGMASRLKRFVPAETDVARLEGDFFALLVQNVSDQREMERFVKELTVSFSSPFEVVDGQDIILSASIGICFYPKDGFDPQSLLENASAAMFHAKAKSKGSFEFYITEMHDQALERKMMELGLRKALEKKELELYYQPKMDIKTGKIVGCEALIRWNREGLVISPAKFIPIAEETGLIVPIGEWVLRTACAQIKAWQLEGFPDLKVSVNLSAYQFRVCDLGTLVAGALWDIGLDAKYLDLELTESLIMDNAERSILMLSVVKRMGVSISIDDFGTGYASLSYLRKFPINTLKIDQSFISKINRSPEDASIVMAVIAIAKSLKLNTIAEGVETEEQMDFLREQCCDEIQGYLCSRPLPAQTFIEFLRNRTV